MGDVKVTRVHETDVPLPLWSWFPDLTADMVRQQAVALGLSCYDPTSGMFPLPVCCWVLERARQVILIDTCLGNCKHRPGFQYADRLSTPFLDRLAAAGVRPEQVDLVLCTHLHFDHVGWNTRLVGGKWIPTFPNAKYIWSSVEQADALRMSLDADTPEFLRDVYLDSIQPVLDAGQAVAVDGEHSVDANILMRPAPGHSPGSLRIEVHSQGDLAIFCGDILHAPLQVPLWPLSSAGCADREQATRSRYKLLSDCVAMDALLIPTHFPDPFVGRVARRGDDFGLRLGWA